jgi:2',3'-cyclic-nucleotide 2'-phosphodiesterase (5'-nucleotidase family)
VRRSRPILLTVVAALLVSAVAAPASIAAATPLSFTILHTNDFHGQLEASGSNPALRVARGE